MLKLSHLNKSFKEKKNNTIEVLRDICFDLHQGEFISIIGPSGCGKTTILRIIAGLESADSGQIIFEKKESKRTNLGYIFQNYNTFPWLNVNGNVKFGLFQEKNNPDVLKRVNEWLQFTGLENFSDFFPKKLSGGMQQRLAIARTMVTEPELILMDEPFGALDLKTRESMQRLLLNSVKKTNCSVLFITHDLQEAIYLSDKILVLGANPGRIIKTIKISSTRGEIRDLFEDKVNLELYNEIISLL